MNKGKRFLFLGTLLLILGGTTQIHKAQAAPAPKIPVVTQDFNGKSALVATYKNRQKSPNIKQKYKKTIFIDDSASLTLLGNLDGYDVTYKSSNSYIVKVDPVSTSICDYYGVSAGTATITIRIKSKSGLFFMNKTTVIKAKVTVSPWAASVKFKRSKYKITEGKSKQIRTTLRPSISKEKPVLESQNTHIATVNQKGVVKAKNIGTTYITATIRNGIQTRCKIIVKQRKKNSGIGTRSQGTSPSSGVREAKM